MISPYTNYRKFSYMFLGMMFLLGCQENSTDVTSNGNSGSNQALSVSITVPDSGQIFSQDQVITFIGKAEYGSNQAIDWDKLVWKSNQAGVIGRGATFERSGLSLSDHTITLTATTDGGQSKSAAKPITVQQSNNGVTTLLNSPPAGAQFKSHDLIQLSGAALDPTGTSVSEHMAFEWRSNIDGLLGYGSRIDPGGLSPGVHTISLMTEIDNPTGSGTLAGNAQLQILVAFDNARSINAEILAPVSGSQIKADTTVTFVGTASQNGNLLSGNQMIWTSSMDDEIGRGESCIVSNFSLGTHRITMTVTGNEGEKTATSMLLHVVE